MAVHMNRLVLINNIDYENPNVIQYSDFDMADAIPPGNFRTIESGDGDYLVAGFSMSNYLYLFKTKKIYAILVFYAKNTLIFGFSLKKTWRDDA